MARDVGWFGENTIEGKFTDDIGVAFEDDGESVTVTGRETYDVDVLQLRTDTADGSMSVDVAGETYDVSEVVYDLTIPAELAVQSGEDVRIDAFSYRWYFTSVSVIDRDDEHTTVRTSKIEFVDQDV